MNIADTKPLLDIGREAYSEVYVHVHGEDDNHYEALDAAIKAVLAAAPAHLSRGVVDEDVVMQAERAFWPAYNEALRVHGTKADCHAIGMRAALQAAALPADTVTVQEAWEWAGGNPGIKATRADLEAALRDLDAVCDEADAALPAVPEGWAPDVSNGGQVSVGDASHTPGRKLWHTDPHGRFWTGYTGTRTAQQLMAECESTIRDLRALLAATPAHDQPKGSDND